MVYLNKVQISYFEYLARASCEQKAIFCLVLDSSF